MLRHTGARFRGRSPGATLFLTRSGCEEPISRGTFTFGVALLLGLASGLDAARSETAPPAPPAKDECEAASAIAHEPTRFLFVNRCHGGWADFSKHLGPPVEPIALDGVEPLERTEDVFKCLYLRNSRSRGR